jgi:predicted permease
MLEGLEDDIRFHIENETQGNIDRGMEPEDARRAALLKFGNVTRVIEDTREVWSTPWIERRLQDVRFGFRMLRKHPSFVMAAVLSLALGIGANTAVFSLVDALLLQRLPVPHPEQLFSLVRVTPQERGESFSYPDFVALGQKGQPFGEIFGYAYRTVRVGFGPQSENATAQLVSDHYFTALAKSAARGRDLDGLGRNAGEDVVISDRYWQREFARSPTALGSTLALNGDAFTIVGIMPAGFSGVSIDYAADLWVPITSQPELDGNSLLSAAGTNWVRVMTRVPPGLSDGAISAAATAVIKQQPHSSGEQSGLRVELENAARPDSGLRHAVTSPLLLLFATVGLLLLVACVNVAHLFEARAAARHHEFSVRLAIGAGRARLLSQLLTESIILATAGGALAVSIAWAATRALTNYISGHSLLANPLPEGLRFHPNLHVLVFAGSVAVVAGIIVGLSPAIRAGDVDLRVALKSSAPSARSNARSRRRWLLTSQMTISLLLLIVAGLLIRSFQKLNEVNLGFSPVGVVQLQVDWGTLYTDSQVRQIAERLLDQFRALPGVSSASMAVPGVFSRSAWQSTFRLQGQSSAQPVLVDVTAAAPGFFGTLGIPLLRGRDFSPLDTQNSEHVVILSETMARTYFPTSDPVGHRVLVQGETIPAEIIGVASDIKLHSVLASAPRLVYVPLTQAKGPVTRFITWVVRSSSPANPIAAVLVRQVHQIDPGLQVNAEPVVDTIAQSILVQRLAAWLTGLFGLIGLLLAAVGAYGLLSYTVVQRVPEIGIRLALGAVRRDVLWLVWRQAMQPIAVGMVLGLLLATAATRLLSSYLFGLSGTDPMTLATCLLLMGVVAGLACYLPARRAAAVDPTTALRFE